MSINQEQLIELGNEIKTAIVEWAKKDTALKLTILYGAALIVIGMLVA